MNKIGLAERRDSLPNKKQRAFQIGIIFLLGLVFACNLSRQAGQYPAAGKGTEPTGDSSSHPTLRSTPEFTATVEASRTKTPIPVENIWPPTVDEVLAQCPTAQEIAEINSRIAMSFESDPTAGVLVCTAAAGSADFTREQKNAYNAILIMKHLAFDSPLPWTDQSLYDWFTGTIKGIRFRSDIVAHTCCGTPPTINIRTELHAYYSDRWTAVGSLMRLYVNEARHTYMAHRCETGMDRTIEELGAYGVEARLYQWLAYHSDPKFLTMLAPGPTIDYREAARQNYYALLQTGFCLDPTPTSLPPALVEHPSAKIPIWTEAMIQASLSGIPVPELLLPAADSSVPLQGAVFTWQSVDFPVGVTYGIEVDALFRFGKDWEYWQARTDAAGLTVPRYAMPISFDGTYSPMGRWRVWAISPTAGAGPKSEWQYFTIGK
jgi:hypothetical protein